MSNYTLASPLFQIHGEKTTLIYAPLLGTACEADARLLNCVCDIIENTPEQKENNAQYAQLVDMGFIVAKDKFVKQAHTSAHLPSSCEFLPVEVTLFLTANCNLNCRYCYGHGGDSKTVMTEELAMAATDLVFENAEKKGAHTIRISFHGGGEPTLEIKRIKQLVKSSLDRARQIGLLVEFGLTTNGCFNHSDLQWVAENIRNLNISFDGPGDIQDYHRPMANGHGSFAKVRKTLLYFDSVQKTYCLRGTITKYSENRIPEIARYVAENHSVRTLQLEPMFSVGRALVGGVAPPDHDLFVQGFLEAEKICSEAEISLKFSGHKFPAPCSNFCALGENNFAVTPEGNVTSCFEVLEETDKRSEKFFFGRYENHMFSFDKERIRQLKTLNDTIPNFCRNCFAQYHCRGDCRGKGLYLASNGVYEGGGRCRIIQGLIREKLLQYFR